MEKSRLSFIADVGFKNGKPKYQVWKLAKYQCVCGKRIIAYVQNVKSGNTRSCGCLRDEQPRGTHNKTKSKVYRAWCAMKRRCLNKNDIQYKDYGGRGVRIDPGWMVSFERFLLDMGEPPSAKHTLDRIDVNGMYTKLNCKWSTYKEQAANKTNTVRYLVMGAEYIVSELGRMSGLNPSCIARRISRGWSIEDAISIKPHPNKGGLRNVKRYKQK